jgi:hypothetical protein
VAFGRKNSLLSGFQINYVIGKPLFRSSHPEVLNGIGRILI